MKRKDFEKELKGLRERTDGKLISSDSLIYIFLKSLELREKGLKSSHFEEQNISFKESY